MEFGECTRRSKPPKPPKSIWAYSGVFASARPSLPSCTPSDKIIHEPPFYFPAEIYPVSRLYHGIANAQMYDACHYMRDGLCCIHFERYKPHVFHKSGCRYCSCEPAIAVQRSVRHIQPCKRLVRFLPGYCHNNLRTPTVLFRRGGY